MNTPAIIGAVKITPAEKKRICETVEKCMAIDRIAEQCRGARGDWDAHASSCVLYRKAEAALIELQENPSLEAAERYHQAVVRRDQATLTMDSIREALHHPRSAAASVMVPILEKIIAEALASTAETAANQRKAMTDAGVAADLVSAHDASTAAARATLEGELDSAKSDPLGWVLRHGIDA